MVYQSMATNILVIGKMTFCINNHKITWSEASFHSTKAEILKSTRKLLASLFNIITHFQYDA